MNENFTMQPLRKYNLCFTRCTGTDDLLRRENARADCQYHGKIEVVVGGVEHPMTDAHYIEWILLETDKGVQIRHLTPSDAPKAVFEVGEGKPLAVYEYCNLHGLWKTEL